MKTTLVAFFISLIAYESIGQKINRFRESQAIDAYFQLKPERKQPLILAHRGGPDATDTENSIPTFDKSAKALPDAIIEMDVRMTRDSGYVLLHDPTLDRESDAKGAVAEWTLADLGKVNLKTLGGELTDQHIPAFADILLWNKNRYMLGLDVKPGTDPIRVMKLVQQHQAVHSVFVICYSVAEAQRVRDQYPTLWLAVGVNSVADLDRFEKDPLIKSGRLIALTPQKLQPISFYERLHKLGIPCSVGTYGAGQLDEKPMIEATTGYQHIFKQGGDIITTDRPIAVSRLF